MSCIDGAYDASMGILFGEDPITWSAVDEPGFPPLLFATLSTFDSTLDTLKEFIPPDPLNLPEIPTPDIFVDTFTGSNPAIPEVSFPFALAGMSLNVDIPGVPVGIPATPTWLPAVPPFPPGPGFDGLSGEDKPGIAKPTLPPRPKEPVPPVFGDELPQNLVIEQPWSPDALERFIKGMITLPHDIVVEMTESVIGLSLEIPDEPKVSGIIVGIFGGLGFPAESVERLALGLSAPIVEMINCKLG